MNGKSFAFSLAVALGTVMLINRTQLSSILKQN